MKPLVLVSILAKQKAEMLPTWLEHVEKWDYPKDRIILLIRSNNNTDDTEVILKLWADKNRKWYRYITENYNDVEAPVQEYGVHEWNPVRFKALGEIRQTSVNAAWQAEADFYFVCDVDNFIKPDTLSKLVEANLPVVAPLLTSVDKEQPTYSNFHHRVTANGYYLDNPEYYAILNGYVRGLIQCDVVHCTYLIRRDVFEHVNYVDGSDDYEYVIFSRVLRSTSIPQYLDNRELYGCLTTRENTNAVVSTYKERFSGR